MRGEVRGGKIVAPLRWAERQAEAKKALEREAYILQRMKALREAEAKFNARSSSGLDVTLSR